MHLQDSLPELIELEPCEEVLEQHVHGAPWHHDLDRALDRSRPPLQSAQAGGSLIGGGGTHLFRERRPPGLQPEALGARRLGGSELIGHELRSVRRRRR